MADDRRIPLTALPLAEIRGRLAQGSLKAIDVAEAYLARIAEEEPGIRAWAWHDPEFVRHQARALDAYRATGRPLGPLHGLPVGLKDIIDTAKIPTANGIAMDAGRVPEKDATIVSRLRAAGAVFMGKTVTTELAFMHPGPTRNPRAPGHTPGGSSSGSAAAVAAGMVPLAVGTQTGGSVIRPAAFCGVTGYKPTFGAISRAGVLRQSQSLDTVGVFAQAPEDAALLAEALWGHDPADPATAPAPAPRLAETCLTDPPVLPTFAFVRPPGWDCADEATKEAFAEVMATLGEDRVFEVELPAIFDRAAEMRERINFAEMARNYVRYEREGGGLSEVTRTAMARGRACPAPDYIAALEFIDVLYSGLEPIFERCDAILAPAALGPAPEGLDSTGDSIFNGLWTMVGVPAVTLPLLETGDGLPMGLQLVGARDSDGRLLRTARWLYSEFG